MIFNVLQILGGLILALGQIPQMIQIGKTKSARDINLNTYLMIFIGALLMEIYAINLVVNGTGLAYLFTNTISLFATGTMIVLIVKYGNKKDI
jgi:MtN3 and saliva related transmembrane protein